MTNKHHILTILVGVCLQVMAIGQEKKQNQAHDARKGMTQGIVYHNNFEKWDDKRNEYTAKNTKNFRFQLKDSLAFQTEVNGVFFLDNLGKIVNYIAIKAKNLPTIEKKIGIAFNLKPIESYSDLDVYHLENLDKNKLSKVMSKINIDSSFCCNPFPKIMEISKPTVFLNQHNLIYCTEITFIRDPNDEERIFIGGMTLIQLFDVNGNETFSFLDSNLSNKRLEVSEDFSYLIQIFGSFSIEGGTENNPGLKLYNLKNKTQKICYHLNSDREESHGVSLKFFNEAHSVLTLLMSDDKIKVIYINNITGALKQKVYSYSEELEDAKVVIDENIIVFKNISTDKILVKDSINTFKN